MGDALIFMMLFTAAFPCYDVLTNDTTTINAGYYDDEFYAILKNIIVEPDTN